MRRGLAPAVAVLGLVLLAGARDAPVGGPGGARPSGRVELTVEADRTAITVGDPIVLTVRLSYPEGTRIVSFDPEGLVAPLELLDAESAAPIRLEDGRIQDVRVYRATLFEIGEREIPGLTATYVPPGGGDEETVASAPMRVQVASVLAENDTEPADIKPPASMPAAPAWPWLLVGAAALAAALWFWRRRRRIPEGAGAAPAAPPRPAHETAYAELERLLSSSLLNEGRVKAFYIELAEIIRRYLAARFMIETFERTSSEILDELRRVRTDTRTIMAADEFFAACDLVKFARYQPASEETKEAVGRAYRLVDETRPQEPAARESAA